MQHLTRLTLALSTVVALASPALINAQAMSSAEPFKVGTFEIGGAPTVGVVLRDALVIDLAAANTALEIDPMYAHVNAPADMLELIGQYEYGLKYRIYDIVNNVVGGNLDADYVHAVDDVRILPPIMYPSKIMNAAVNFYTHACEGCTPEELQANTRERQENRGVPYLFLKPTRGAVIGSGEDIIMPWGRDRIEWEVELAIVIGRAGKYISSAVRTTTCSATRSPWTYPTVAGVRRVGTAPVLTGSSVRVMTPSRPKGRGLFQKNSTGIPWSVCTRVWSSTA